LKAILSTFDNTYGFAVVGEQDYRLFFFVHEGRGADLHRMKSLVVLVD